MTWIEAVLSIRRLAVMLGLVASGCNAPPELAVDSGADGSGGGTTGGDDSTCGNGIVEEGEQCDLGFANNDEGECTTSCMLPACGDGFIGPAEDCDDGNNEDGDGCLADCTFPMVEVWSDTVMSGIALGITIDPNGDVIVVGGRGSEPYSAWIRKLDPDLVDLWAVYLHGEEDAGASAHDVAVGPEGDVFVVGTSTHEANGRNDAWVGRYTVDGAEVWSWTRGTNALDDAFYGVATDGDFVYLAGLQGNTSSDTDAVVIKIDPSAETLEDAILWEHIHGSAAGWRDAAADLVVNDTGEVTVVGYETLPGAQAEDDTAVWLRRLGADGNEVWTKTENGPAGGQDAATGIVALAAGGVLATGYLTMQGSPAEPQALKRAVWVGAYDDDGNLIWSRTVQDDELGSRWGKGVATSDAGIVVAVGVTPILTPGCTIDCLPRLWLGLFEADGAPVWTWEEPGAHGSEGTAVAFDDAGCLYVVGSVSDLAVRKALIRKYALR